LVLCRAILDCGLQNKTNYLSSSTLPAEDVKYKKENALNDFPKDVLFIFKPAIRSVLKNVYTP
jgi:hypothetical protein